MGNHIIGLASTGLHSNGYTLVRRLIFDQQHLKPEDPLVGSTVAEELLKPTRIYIDPVHVLLRDFAIHGIAHITGGGLIDNVPRILPHGCQAVINKETWEVPEIFQYLQYAGNIAELEMHRTFNMGLGLVLVVRADQSQEIMERLQGMQEPAYLIGEIKERPDGAEPLILI